MCLPGRTWGQDYQVCSRRVGFLDIFLKLNKPEGVLSEFPTLEIEMDGTTREFYLFATFFFIT